MEKTIKERQVEIMLIELIEVKAIDIETEGGFSSHWKVRIDNDFVSGSVQMTHEKAIKYFNAICELKGQTTEEKLIKKSIIKK